MKRRLLIITGIVTLFTLLVPPVSADGWGQDVQRLEKSGPAKSKLNTNPKKAIIRTVFVTANGGCHLGTGMRYSRSCSNPNWHPLPQSALLEIQLKTNKTTSIPATGSATLRWTNAPVNNVRNEETGFGLSDDLSSRP